MIAAVREIMTKQVRSCTPSMSVREAAQMMLEEDCGMLPVIDSDSEGRLLGMITDRDIVCRAVARGEDPGSLPVQHCMSTPVKTVRDDASIKQCVDVMKRNKVRRVPVINSEGSLCGLVSLADLATNQMSSEAQEAIEFICKPTKSGQSLQQ